MRQLSHFEQNPGLCCTHTSAMRIFAASSSGVVVQGKLLRGMSMRVVLPPAAAAVVPVSMPAGTHRHAAAAVAASTVCGVYGTRVDVLDKTRQNLLQPSGLTPSPLERGGKVAK